MPNIPVVDISNTIVHLATGLDGITRVELSVAKEMLALGGKAIWIEKDRIYQIDREALAALLAVAETARKRRLSRSKIAREVVRLIAQRRMLQAARRKSFSPRGNECYFLLGAYWEPPTRHIPALLASGAGSRVYSFVHDLIPVRHPELTYDSEKMRKIFPGYLHALISASGEIGVSSEFTASELRAYCAERGWKCPPLRVVPLASDLDLRASPQPSERTQSPRLARGKFVLMVSTLEPRKNHRFALDLWNELETRAPDKTIPLVFAGKRGWLSSKAMAEIERRSRAENSNIVLFESASDSELAWLYQNAAFTIYPSVVEGWGLPISESLCFGTYCLAADNSSLRESSRGYAWHGALTDRTAWIEEVLRCLNDPAYLADRSARIRTGFEKRRWRDVAAELIAAAC